MSSGRVPVPLARALARKLMAELAPYVERIMVVGSLRRMGAKPGIDATVGDVEILCEPKLRSDGDLFSPEDVPELEPIRRLLSRKGELVKAGDRFMQVLVGMAPRGGAEDDRIPVDLFLCHPPADWGVLEAIRTGPAHYSRYCVTKLREKGWRCANAQVWAPADSRGCPSPPPSSGFRNFETDGGTVSYQRVDCPTEEDFFEACGVPLEEPGRRGCPSPPPSSGFRNFETDGGTVSYQRVDCPTEEDFQRELSRFIANIQDPNTEHKPERKVTLEIRFRPDKMRDSAAVDVRAKSKLVPHRAVPGRIYMGMRDGELTAVPYDPRQLDASRVPLHYREVVAAKGVARLSFGHAELPLAYGHLCREHQEELHRALCDVALAFDCPFSRLIVFPEPQEAP